MINNNLIMMKTILALDDSGYTNPGIRKEDTEPIILEIEFHLGSPRFKHIKQHKLIINDLYQVGSQ